jgi:hypothetical protein
MTSMKRRGKRSKGERIGRKRHSRQSHEIQTEAILGIPRLPVAREGKKYPTLEPHGIVAQTPCF